MPRAKMFFTLQNNIHTCNKYFLCDQGEYIATNEREQSNRVGNQN